MADRYQAWIEGAAAERPQLAAALAELGELYHRKLWHQLTVKLEQYIEVRAWWEDGAQRRSCEHSRPAPPPGAATDAPPAAHVALALCLSPVPPLQSPEFQEGGFLVALYKNFVAGFAHKINLLKLAFVAVAAGKQMARPEVSGRLGWGGRKGGAAGAAAGHTFGIDNKPTAWPEVLLPRMRRRTRGHAWEARGPGRAAVDGRSASSWPYGLLAFTSSCQRCLPTCGAHPTQEGEAFIRDVLSALEAAKQPDSEQPEVFLRMQLAQYALVQGRLQASRGAGPQPELCGSGLQWSSSTWLQLPADAQRVRAVAPQLPLACLPPGARCCACLAC